MKGRWVAMLILLSTSSLVGVGTHEWFGGWRPAASNGDTAAGTAAAITSRPCSPSYSCASGNHRLVHMLSGKRLRGGVAGSDPEHDEYQGEQDQHDDSDEGKGDGKKGRFEGDAGGADGWMAFDIARALVHEQHFKRKIDYVDWVARPKGLPVDPAKVYDACWQGWAHFFGTPVARRRAISRPAPSEQHALPSQIKKKVWLMCGECDKGAVWGVSSLNLTKWDLLLCRVCEKRFRLGGSFQRNHKGNITKAFEDSSRKSMKSKNIKLLNRRCFECPQFASFGPMPAHIEYPMGRSSDNVHVVRPWHCKKHALEGETDVIHGEYRCTSYNCSKIASFGPRGGKAVACKDHMCASAESRWLPPFASLTAFVFCIHAAVRFAKLVARICSCHSCISTVLHMLIRMMLLYASMHAFLPAA